MNGQPPVAPAGVSDGSQRSLLPAKSWKHFVAGGLGGMSGAIVTSPFDVVKTRLQSDLFKGLVVQRGGAMSVGLAAEGATLTVTRGSSGLLWHFVETTHILRDIYKYEGVSALFKGLGPTLVGVVPARSINFFTYGNGKQIIADNFNGGQESTVVHLSAAAIAGIVTSTATNPIWVVKTRLQLAVNSGASHGQPKFRNSFHCATHILRNEGIRGLYKGMSASYLGATEGTIQWVLYERLKKVAITASNGNGGFGEWMGMLGAAGFAKMAASLVTYPHEVIRTRLRQPAPLNGKIKYTGLAQTLRVIIAEEGAVALYSGLTAHLFRVVPNAAIMYSIYEGVLRWGNQ